MKSKKASLMHQIIVHLILIALIFAMFFMSASYRTESKGVKQQVLEKQLALLIDSAEPNTTIIVRQIYMNGKVSNMEIKQGRIFVYVNDQGYSKGYPYFTKYELGLEKDNENYYIKIK